MAKTDEPGTSGNTDVDIIEKSIGAFKRWQIITYILICLTKLFIYTSLMNIVFIAPPIKYWCTQPANVTDACCDNCTKHEFDTSIFASTMTTQWDLICHKKYLADFAQTITMVASLLGNTFGGIISDKYGRRHPTIVFSLVQAVGHSLSAFIPWFWLFLILRFISSFATGVVMTTGFVYIMEIVGKKWRPPLGILYHAPFPISQALMPLVSYYLPDWRHFLFAVSLPGVLFIFYYLIIPESPRWELAVGRNEKAIKTLTYVAKFNKMSYENIENDVNNHDVRSKGSKSDQRKSKLKDFFKERVLMTYTLILWFFWFCNGLGYYGASQFVGYLSGNFFINQVIVGTALLPGLMICAWVLEYFGRKKTNVAGGVISGICLIITAFMPEDIIWPRSILAACGISMTLFTFAAIYILSCEIFPTVVRNTGVGSCSTLARCGSTIAPFIASITPHWIPPTIFGTGMLVGGLLSLKLPETKDCILPETIEEVKHLGKKK